MPEETIIEMQAIETLRALSPDDGGAFLRELIEIYLQDTPQRLAELEQGVAGQNASALIRAAHSIKGSSGNFGAYRFARLAEEIEQQGKAGNMPATAALCLKLKTDYVRVAEALTQIAQGN
jgi:HPt (histidine-containing phosphotransfer) domain-containing protein